MNFKNAKILCVCAHPDDESYIVGGTIALAARQGADITVISVTKGDKGFQNVENTGEKERLTEIREQELKDASRILGVKEVILWDYPDGGLDELSKEREQTLVQQLVDEIGRKKPEIILTFGPDGVSGHRDHIAIGALALRAARTYAKQRRLNTRTHAELEAYGITYPKELNQYLEKVLAVRNKTVGHFKKHQERHELSPTLSEVEKIDISEVIDVKFQACRAHKTQDPEGLIHAATSQPEKFWKNEYFLPYGTT